MPITKHNAYQGNISWSSGCARIGFLVSILQFCLINLIAQGVSVKEIDPTDLKEQATRVLNTYCVSCHGAEKQKGDVQLKDLESLQGST